MHGLSSAAEELLATPDELESETDAVDYTLEESAEPVDSAAANKNSPQKLQTTEVNDSEPDVVLINLPRQKKSIKKKKSPIKIAAPSQAECN